MARDPERERQWRRVIARWQQRSGGSIRGFCRSAGISESLFHYWRRELERRDREKSSGHGSGVDSFVELMAVQSKSGSGGDAEMGSTAPIEVVLGANGDLIVRMTSPSFDRRALADALAIVIQSRRLSGDDLQERDRRC